METCFLFRILTLISSFIPALPVFAFDPLGIADGAIQWSKDAIDTSMGELGSVGDAMCSIYAGTDTSGLADALNTLESRITLRLCYSGAGIGMIICFACWLFAVIDLIIQDRISPETFIKSTARLALGFALCASASDIYSGCKEFGILFAQWVEEAIRGSNSVTVAIDFGELEKAKDNWPIIMLNTAMFNTVILLTAGAMKIAAYIVQVTRIIEMSIRGGFLGVAFGMIADDGWRGPGGRYIKKFLAVCCQGGVLVLLGKTVAYLQSQLMANAFSTLGAFSIENMSGYWSSTFLCIGIGFAGVSMMFKSLGYVNDLFGA